MRRYFLLILAAAAAVMVPAAQAGQRGEARSLSGSADLQADVGATTALTSDPGAIYQARIPNGGSATVKALTFTLSADAYNNGPDTEPALATFGLELPPGLHWAPTQADTSCTLTASAASCTVPEAIAPQIGGYDYWRVTADAPGTYVIKAHATGSLPDPNTANNESVASVVVQELALAQSVKVSPARPKAGSFVTVRVVGVTVGGEPVAPTGLSCSGSIAGKTLTGTGRATVGKATCAYRTPKSAKGKRLRGVISFTASHTQLAKRFAIKLR